jgi:biofilm PGA synthesis lipoprotein PgaB
MDINRVLNDLLEKREVSRRTFIKTCVSVTSIITLSSLQLPKIGEAAKKSGDAKNGVIILCYHDVCKNLYNEFATTPENLEAHFRYLKDHGYHPISLQQYIDANENKILLPDKPILITFDDGYVAFYTTVFPLLEKFNFPAVMALVTYWQDSYKPPDIGQLITWQQARNMENSGLVTIACHTHNSHHGVTANSDNDGSQATSTLIYFNGTYETLDHYKARMTADFSKAQSVFEQNLGHRVKALVWPYGEYTQYAVEAAQQAGVQVCMGLFGGSNSVGNPKSLLEAKRSLIYENPTVDKFAEYLKLSGNDDPSMRAAWLDIDHMVHTDTPAQLTAVVRNLIEQYNNWGINAVFLKAYSDSAVNGNIDSVYFYTTAAPMKALLFDHIARMFRSENILVYAVMPTLDAQWLTNKQSENAIINANGQVQSKATPFSTDVQNQLVALYNDLALYSFIDGIIFQDTDYLTNNDDFSESAKVAFQKATGEVLNPENLQDQQLLITWINMKTQAMTDLTNTLMKQVLLFKPYGLSMLGMKPVVTKEGQSVPSYQSLVDNYNYILTISRNNGQFQTPSLISHLAEAATQSIAPTEVAGKFIFEIPIYDPSSRHWLSDDEIKQYMKVLGEKGITMFSYYPLATFGDQTRLTTTSEYIAPPGNDPFD